MRNPEAGGLTPAEREIAQMEAPSLEAKYELFSGALMESLEKLTPQIFSEAKQKIEQVLPDVKDDEVEGLQNLKSIIDRVASLRSSKNLEQAIADLGRTKLFELADADSIASVYCPNELKDAIYQLNEASFALTRARFPEDVKKQRAAREEADRGRVSQLREELMKKKVG